jgi:SAM-dependent methyltransferase
MWIDWDRVRDIIEAGHSYYGAVTKRVDGRWYPGLDSLIRGQLSVEMRVLDVGCGDGSMLLELSPSFLAGVGIDCDPAHLQIAEAAGRAQGVENVEWMLLDFPNEAARLERETFDLVFSMRGPIPDTPQGIQAALDLLRPGGLLLCEEIGERHQPEAGDVFGDSPGGQAIPRAGLLKAALERGGVDVRLAADLFTKWIYPDLYAWLQYQCNIWTWCGVPLPEPGDPRIVRFAERYTNATREIETTHHVVWVAGVKK